MLCDGDLCHTMTNVPLAANWQNFLSLPGNKVDLANFLSVELISQAPENKKVLTAGGFIADDIVQSNKADMNLEELRSNHEEADARITLHTIHCRADPYSSTFVITP